MQTLDLKRLLVGTDLGRAMLRRRKLREITRSVRENPEQGAILCEDLCTQTLLPRLCAHDHTFVDVGAHIGSVIGEVRHVSESIRIIGIEADPAKADALERKFPSIELHKCALGDQDGEVHFFVDRKRPGYSSLAQGDRENAEVDEIVVPMRRLDDLVPEAAEVDVIKIDVEGAELGVLRGSEALVSRCRPAIVFESGPQAERNLGYTVESMHQWFTERDYQLVIPSRVAHDGPSLGLEGFVESHAYPRRTGDYFGIPSERRIDFRDRARAALGVVPTH